MATNLADTVTVNPSEETIEIGQLRIHFLVTGERSNGSMAVFEMMVPAGAKLAAPAHSHEAYDETIYGLNGVLTFTVAGTRIDIAPGEALCIPRGAVHRFDNFSQADATALAVLTPAAIGPAFFRESAAAINAAAGGPPDRETMLAIYRRHGLTPAPPSAM